ncbi:MAG: NAD(P)-dependent oxidoreductase [Actinobacteria bacterium]|nr:NAD(P)-dependent oxidoreductase [Actinomycetota bacterium]
MLGLNLKLKELAAQGKSINVGIVGLGQMGLSLIAHLKEIQGFKVCACSDLDMKKADKLRSLFNNEKEEIFVWENTNVSQTVPLNLDEILKSDIPGSFYPGSFSSIGKDRLNAAVKAGRLVFTNDFSVLWQIDEINVIVDATGFTKAGAEIALGALCGGKDVVTLNVETDVTVGPMLKKIADQRGLVYTLSAGDEPAALKELYDFADGLGFKIVCAGKGKNNPLDIEANPESLAEYAAKKGSSAKMMTTFVDGTKSMVEMACLSNATGLVADCRGMHGPRADIKDILGVFSLKEQGGILEKEGVVDFVIGDLAPGVFLVYRTENQMVKDVINYLNLGTGPNYLIYRPYHLTSIETPLSIALAYFNRQPWIVPLEKGLISEVITVAKKDLAAGSVIDGIGGYTIYGLIELYDEAKKQDYLPIGLCQGCILKNPKKKGEPLLYRDVEFTENPVILQMRKMQDRMIQK